MDWLLFFVSLRSGGSGVGTVGGSLAGVVIFIVVIVAGYGCVGFGIGEVSFPPDENIV